MLTRAFLSVALGIGLGLVPMSTCSQIEMAGGCGWAGTTEQDVWLELRRDDPDLDGRLGEEPSEPRCDVMHAQGCIGYITTVPLAAPITMSDIARFRPSAPVDSMEPNGWAIIGLHTNFYATGDTQIVDGTLLGQPASVRFTPVSWRWTYGDGTSSVASTRGGSWVSQGIPEFDPTSTSHVYRLPGTFLIDLSVDYRAEYRFGGGGWTRIAGVLSVPANQLEVTAGDAKTVLVSRDCTVNPKGSGC